MTEQEERAKMVIDILELVYLLNSDKRQKIELNDYSYVYQGNKKYLVEMGKKRNVK